MLVVAIILGVVLFKKFDFEKFRFEEPAIAVVYIIGFVIAVVFLIKTKRNS
jgi:predicted ferric reductase